MSEPFDFERYWLAKFARCLEEAAGVEVQAQVMAGSDRLSATSAPEEVIAWTQGAMERLEALVDRGTSRAILTGCACHYPKADLQPMREAYEQSGDLDLAHRMLQAQFESFLRDTLRLSDELFDAVVSRGWGAAGIKEGNRIVATKIPKSGYLVQYLEEPDPARKREIYCHCPRVRDALRIGERLSPTYCYCGAGFYQGIWEEIVGQPVAVEVLESVLDGGEVCRIGIYLPEREA